MIISKNLLLKMFGCFLFIIFVAYSAKNLTMLHHTFKNINVKTLKNTFNSHLPSSSQPGFLSQDFGSENKIPINYKLDQFKNRSIDRHSKQMLELISVTNHFDINLFIIDPFINFQLLDESQRRLLIERSLLSADKLNKLKKDEDFCVSFAVFAHHFRNIQTKLSRNLKKRSFREIQIKGKDGSKRNISVNESDLNEVLLHLFYFKANDCIQLTVLHQRNDFLWIGKVDKTQVNDIKKKYHFGNFEEAFDSIIISKPKSLQMKNKKVLFKVPENSVHFLSQLKSSRFIECNYGIATSFRQKYQQMSQATIMNEQVREGLILMKNITTSMMIPFFIACGTLLGWYRQCGVISYTTDLDTGSWSTYATEQTVQSFINNDIGLKMKYLFGLPENGLELAVMTPSGLKIDLFFLYPENDKLSVTGHIVYKKAYRRYYYPKFTLCSAELEGIKVLVACDPQIVLESEYGKDWDRPKEKWDWEGSPPNAGPIIQWPKHIDFNTVFKQFS